MMRAALSVFVFLSVVGCAHADKPWKWDDEIGIIARHSGVDRVYRVGLPLRGVDRWLWVILAVPSDSMLKKQLDVIDTAAAVVGRSQLYAFEIHGGQIATSRKIALNDELFEKLLSAFYVSEVFALPEARPPRYDDYFSRRTLGDGIVCAERLSNGATIRIVRNYSDSAPCSYLANRVAEIVGDAVERNWQAGREDRFDEGRLQSDPGEPGVARDAK